MTKKKIVLVTYHGGLGGASRLVHDLAMRLRRQGTFEVSVLYAHQIGTLGAQLRADGIRVECAGMRHGLDIIHAAKLTRFLRDVDFDVIHLHYFTPLLRIATLFGAGGKSVVLTRHVGVQYEGSYLYYLVLNRFLLRRKDYVVAVSDYVRSEVIRLRFGYPERTALVYNGVEIDRFSDLSDKRKRDALRSALSISDDTFLIGTVRGLDGHHGVDHLIKAVPYLRAKIAKFHICIVGDGILREEFERLAVSLEADDRISFLGPRSDVSSILSSFDVFVMPSKNESFGLAAVEAMARELPVVAYSVGGLPEVVADGITGILVEKREPDQLAEAIVRLARDPTLRREMGREGLQRVKGLFSFDVTFDRYMKIYQQVMSEA